jgi:hypothetical protein
MYCAEEKRKHGVAQPVAEAIQSSGEDIEDVILHNRDFNCKGKKNGSRFTGD